MLPLTDNQKSTLTRWASYNLGRPQDGFMAFLMGETGLQEEQINHWWTNHESTRITPEQVAPLSKLNAYDAESNGLDLSNINLPNSAFDPFGDSIQNFDADFSDLENWSALEQSCYDFLGQHSASMGCHPQENWGDKSSEKNLFHSDTISVSDTDSVLSMSSVYGSKRTSNRSSGLSYASGRTWGTASTLFSVDEDQAPGPMNANQNFHHHEGISSPNVALVSKSQYMEPGEINSKQFNTRHHSLESTPLPRTTLRRKSSTNLNTKKLPDIPQKFVRYSCTTCGQSFERKGAKGDWKRHEQTKCEQQKLWYCMPKEPTIQVLNVWHCMLCNFAENNRNEMINHLINRHRFQNCWGKPLSERSHPRKDKLRDHLKKHHGLADGSTGWEAWHQDLPEKKAWGCGFCGDCFFTWDARLDHIAEHYEKQGLDVSQWSLINVIKGLLKQPREWDVSAAWRALVGQNDRSHTWRDDDALVLRRKLEYREGTPQSLAEEARRLAKRSSHNVVPQTWPLSESHAARLARNMLSEPLRKIPGRGDGRNSYGDSFMAGVQQAEARDRGGGGNFNGYI